MPRKLHEIARDIVKDMQVQANKSPVGGSYRRKFFAAAPYLDAMSRIEAPGDRYGAESARDIVQYFLGNAATWRGERARALKAELKELLK